MVMCVCGNDSSVATIKREGYFIILVQTCFVKRKNIIRKEMEGEH
jgi:hypothetical protein